MGYRVGGSLIDWWGLKMHVSGPFRTNDDAIIKPKVAAESAGHGRRAFSPAGSKESLRVRLYVMLLLVDVVAIGSGFGLANLIWLGNGISWAGLVPALVVLPLFLILAFSKGAYSLRALEMPRHGIRNAAQSFLFAMGLLLVSFFLLKASAEFSRAVLALSSSIGLTLIVVGRHLVGRFAGRRHNWNFVTTVMLVESVSRYPHRGEIVLFLDPAELPNAAEDPVFLDRVGRLLKNCDRAVLACPPDRRLPWLASLKGLGVDLEVLAPELDELGALEARRMGDAATLVVSRGPMTLRHRMQKRAFDLALAVPAALFLLPVFAVVAIAIKLDSPGPIFFKQPRIGLGNRIFDVFKFRSMRNDTLDAEASRLTQKSDSRVTRVGAFLRSSSIDELPQLINVLRGDMSLVGPRPHALGATAGDALYWKVDDRYFMRHAVKPGITGLAQVRGHRGTTFERKDLENRLHADLEYLHNWSIWREVAILLSTIRVLFHKNAF